MSYLTVLPEWLYQFKKCRFIAKISKSYFKLLQPVYLQIYMKHMVFQNMFRFWSFLEYIWTSLQDMFPDKSQNCHYIFCSYKNHKYHFGLSHFQYHSVDPRYWKVSEVRKVASRRPIWIFMLSLIVLKPKPIEQYSLSVLSPASPILESGWVGRQDLVRPRKHALQISKIISGRVRSHSKKVHI